MFLENSERSTIVNLYMPNGSFLICRRRRLDLYILHPTEHQPTEPPTTCCKVHQNEYQKLGESAVCRSTSAAAVSTLNAH